MFALSVICFANASSPKGRAEKPVQPTSPDESGKLWCRLVSVLLLPSRLAPRHLPQGGRLFLTRSPNLSLHLGEMSRSDREGRLPCEGAGLPLCGKTEGVCQIGKIRMRFTLRCTCPRVCPLSHLLRKCQLSRRESQEVGANRTHASSGYLLRRLARVLLFPSRLAPCHLPQGGRLWFYAQTKPVSPFGRDVAQRQRGPFS